MPQGSTTMLVNVDNVYGELALRVVAKTSYATIH